MVGDSGRRRREKKYFLFHCCHRSTTHIDLKPESEDYGALSDVKKNPRRVNLWSCDSRLWHVSAWWGGREMMTRHRKKIQSRFSLIFFSVELKHQRWDNSEFSHFDIHHVAEIHFDNFYSKHRQSRLIYLHEGNNETKSNIVCIADEFHELHRKTAEKSRGKWSWQQAASDNDECVEWNRMENFSSPSDEHVMRRVYVSMIEATLKIAQLSVVKSDGWANKNNK